MMEHLAQHEIPSLTPMKKSRNVMVPRAVQSCFLAWRCNVDDYDRRTGGIGGYGGAPILHATITSVTKKLPNLC